jgi:hypothetical protein
MLHRFFWLSSQVSDGLFYFWPVTLVLSVLLFVATVHYFFFKRRQLRKRHALVLSPLALSLLVLIWGTIMAHQGTTRGPEWASNVVGIVFLLHIPLAVAVIYLMRGIRLFATALVLFELWFGGVCTFIAAMSVSNVWL